MATMYFAKVNLNSEIYKAMEDHKRFKEILEELFERISSKVICHYYNNEPISQEDWEYEVKRDPNRRKNLYKVKFIQLEKNLESQYITGRVTKIYHEELEKYDEVKDDVVETFSEQDLAKSIAFYFDVGKEWIAFTTKRGFGYRQFRQFVQDLINTAHREAEFEVFLQPNVDKFREQLKNVTKALELQVSLVIPNNSKEYFDDLFGPNLDEVKELESTKIEQKYSTSAKTEGLNMDSRYMNRVVEGADRGYGKVRVEGRRKNNEPIVVATDKNLQTRWIHDNVRDAIPSIKEFGQKFISQIMSNLYQKNKRK